MAREKIPEHTERAATFCRNAKPEEKQYELIDSKIPGLQLRVNPSGKKAWALRYSVGSGENLVKNRLPLGLFPEVTVTEARKAAQQAKSDITRGADPVGERKAEAERKIEQEKARVREEASRITVAKYFETWMSSEKPSNRKGEGADLRRRFEDDVLPVIGHLEMKAVRRQHILAVTDAVLARKTELHDMKRTANVVLAELKQFFKFAEAREVIELNPTLHVEKSEAGGTTESRNRTLDAYEIRRLFKMLHTCSLNRPAQLSFLIMLSTLCRVGEFTMADWSEVDFDKREWNVPGSHTKNGKPIKINLSLFALGLFEELHTITGHTPWVMPNLRETGHLDLKALTKHAHDRQRPEGAKPLVGRTVETRSLASGSEPWTPHDLRRSGATLMQQLEFIPEVSERCLNHTEDNKVKAAYHRHSYQKEMKRAWYALGEALDVITGPTGQAFLKDFANAEAADPDEQVGMLELVKKHYKKPDERSQPA